VTSCSDGLAGLIGFGCGVGVTELSFFFEEDLEDDRAKRDRLGGFAGGDG
jgi:hypothetical protein